MIRRIASIGVIVALATVETGSQGGPVRPTPMRGMTFDSHDTYSTATEFAALEDAQAIVRGSPTTGYLGLYIFDPRGNCIAMDDLGDYQTRNDLAVQWFVLRRAPYQMDVVNHSDRIGEFIWVLR